MGEEDTGARTVELRTVATAVTRVLAAQLDQPQFAVDKLGMLPSETATTPDVVWVVRAHPPPCTPAARSGLQNERIDSLSRHTYPI